MGSGAATMRSLRLSMTSRRAPASLDLVEQVVHELVDVEIDR